MTIERFTPEDAEFVRAETLDECAKFHLGPYSTDTEVSTTLRALVYSVNFCDTRKGQVESVLAEMRVRVAQTRQDNDTIRRHVLRTAEAA